MITRFDDEFGFQYKWNLYYLVIQTAGNGHIINEQHKQCIKYADSKGCLLIIGGTALC